MNTALLKITAGLGLALSLGLTSCTETSLVTPDKPLAATSPSPNDIISPNLPQKHTLIKHGQANLTYYADGRLKRVMYGPDVRGSLALRREYTYGTGVINVTGYKGTETISQETYWLNANTGRCYESKVLSYNQSAPLYNVEQVYTYTDKGQLKTVTDKNYAIHSEFIYSVDGDLIKETNYTNYADPSVVSGESTYAYDQPTGDPILPDFYPLNPAKVFLPDDYLPIFGKLSKHLIKLITYKKLPTQKVLVKRYYSYKLNADGYVNERQEFDLLTNYLVETKAYEYLVTDIGLQF